MELVAAFLAVVLIGIPLGWFWGLQGLAARKRGRDTTLEQYAADFEKWKLQSDSTAGPLTLAVLLCVGLGAYTVVYEVIKQLLVRMF